eukprot:scaffold27801_cov83-Phaeocystis_antarctica.AAC.3
MYSSVTALGETKSHVPTLFSCENGARPRGCKRGGNVAGGSVARHAAAAWHDRARGVPARAQSRPRPCLPRRCCMRCAAPASPYPSSAWGCP